MYVLITSQEKNVRNFYDVLGRAGNALFSTNDIIRKIYCPTRQSNIFIFEKILRKQKKKVLHNFAFKRMPQLFFGQTVVKIPSLASYA